MMLRPDHTHAELVELMEDMIQFGDAAVVHREHTGRGWGKLAGNEAWEVFDDLVRVGGRAQRWLEDYRTEENDG